jgi:hypothetical protein
MMMLSYPTLFTSVFLRCLGSLFCLSKLLLLGDAVLSLQHYPDLTGFHKIKNTVVLKRISDKTKMIIIK